MALSVHTMILVSDSFSLCVLLAITPTNKITGYNIMQEARAKM